MFYYLVDENRICVFIKGGKIRASIVFNLLKSKIVKKTEFENFSKIFSQFYFY